MDSVTGGLSFAVKDHHETSLAGSTAGELPESSVEKRIKEVVVTFFMMTRENSGLEWYIVLKTNVVSAHPKVIPAESDSEDETDTNKQVSLLRQSFEKYVSDPFDSIVEAKKLVENRMLKTSAINDAKCPITYTRGEEFSVPMSKQIFPVYAVVDLTPVRSSSGQDRVVRDLSTLLLRHGMRAFPVSDNTVKSEKEVSLTTLAPGFRVSEKYGDIRIIAGALNHVYTALPKPSWWNVWGQGTQRIAEWRHSVVIVRKQDQSEGVRAPKSLWQDIAGWTWQLGLGLKNRVIEQMNQVVQYVSRSHAYVYNAARIEQELHED